MLGNFLVRNCALMIGPVRYVTQFFAIWCFIRFTIDIAEQALRETIHIFFKSRFDPTDIKHADFLCY